MAKGSIVGNRATACKAASAYYVSTVLQVGASSYTATSDYSSDQNCQSLQFRTIETGTYLAGTMDINGTGNILWTLVSLTFNPTTASESTMRNTAVYCGYSNCVAGTAKSILGATCAGSLVPISGSVLFDIFNIEQKTYNAEVGAPYQSIKFGTYDASHDGLSAATRPTVLNGARVYILQ